VAATAARACWAVARAALGVVRAVTWGQVAPLEEDMVRGEEAEILGSGLSVGEMQAGSVAERKAKAGWVKAVVRAADSAAGEAAVEACLD